MTVLGPGDPRAIVKERLYSITFIDREGEERTFSKRTTWEDFLKMKRLIEREEFEIVKWGYEEE